MLRRRIVHPPALNVRCMGMGGGSPYASKMSPSAKDKTRSQDGANQYTGDQMTVMEAPDYAPTIAFRHNTAEHVKVPEVPMERRMHSDLQRAREIEKKWGAQGPGKQIEQNAQDAKREMLEKQQDVDGLPWEVRWRKNLIPTSEEMLQDMRDRYELYYQDPIEREKLWYLHWKDRGFEAQPDRLIWPQGFTDYLDQYDETGRRRSLPSDQKWTKENWKSLSDERYRDRLWLIEGEDRKVQSKIASGGPQELIEAADRKNAEELDMFMGLTYGVINPDQESGYEAIAGTADPIEVAKTKFKISEYSMEAALKAGRATECEETTGLPKAQDGGVLESGLKIEQAAALALHMDRVQETMDSRAEKAWRDGESGIGEYSKTHLGLSRLSGDKPVISSSVSDQKKKYLALNEAERKRKEALAGGGAALPEGNKQVEASETASAAHITEGAEATTKEEANVAAAAATEASADVDTEPLTPEDVRQRILTPKKSDAMVSDEVSAELEKKVSGFETIAKRAAFEEPNIPQEQYHSAKGGKVSGMPKWYDDAVVHTQPLIQTYGMTQDPVETMPVPEGAYEKAPRAHNMLKDDLRGGNHVNSFDETVYNSSKVNPEQTQDLNPLPTYKDEIRRLANEKDVKKKSKAEEMKEAREKRKTKIGYDADLLLPDLPWETNSLLDPYRGVMTTDEVDFDKAEMTLAFRTYKQFMQQKLAEFSSLNGVTSWDKIEKFLQDCIERVQKGHVGDYPQQHEKHETILRLIFESHFRQFYADILKYQGGRKPDSEAMKAAAEETLERATGKAKQCGKKFMDFIQEHTACELEEARRNPIQRGALTMPEKKMEPLGLPFGRWINDCLTPFIQSEFNQQEQIDIEMKALTRTLHEARAKAPRRIEGVVDQVRDYCVEAVFHWCHGTLMYHVARQFWSMYLKFADTRFRASAEEYWEQSYELLGTNYRMASKEVGVFAPIPGSEPHIAFADSEYLDGENAQMFEIHGDFKKAEGYWQSGTTLRWYPLFDETEAMHFYERRGKISQAENVSDRTLESLNKRTHPSIHPFPERARQFLEDAPLTQETAEHLWLRHMGDTYCEHAEFNARIGRYETSREMTDKGIKFYVHAMKLAEERLPSTWKATLYTKALYLCKSFGLAYGEEKYQEWIDDCDKCIEAIYALDTKPLHWVDRKSETHMRFHLFNSTVWGRMEVVCRRAMKEARENMPEREEAMNMYAARANGKPEASYMAKYDALVDAYSIPFRQRCVELRDRELKGTLEWHGFNLAYFTIKVQPKTPEEAEALYEMLYPTWEDLYTRMAIGHMHVASRFNECIRRLSQILLGGSKEHKERLLGILTDLKEKMRYNIQDIRELDRAIQSLTVHLKDPSTIPYVYLNNQMMQLMQKVTTHQTNPAWKATPRLEDKEFVKQTNEGLKKYKSWEQSAQTPFADLNIEAAEKAKQKEHRPMPNVFDASTHYPQFGNQ